MPLAIQHMIGSMVLMEQIETLLSIIPSTLQGGCDFVSANQA